METWLVKLDKCPHCDKDLNISSLSSESLKGTVGRVIKMSNAHLLNCSEKKEKKLGTILIKSEIITKSKSKVSTYETCKLLM